MITLKSVLLESDDSIFKRELNDLLPTGDLVYRGSKTQNVSTVKKIIPRKDRKPLSTFQWLDDLVEGYRQSYFPNKPSRREAVFATRNYTQAAKYGNLYYVFYPKSAKIFVHGESDSISYMMMIGMSLKRLHDVDLSIDELNQLDNKMKAFFTSKLGKCDMLYVGSHLQDLDKLKRNDPYLDKRFHQSLEDTLKDLNQYEMNTVEIDSSRKAGRSEILILTPYYYMVNVEWYDAMKRDTK